MTAAAEMLAGELRSLHRAAGEPTLATLVRQAGRQQPPIKLNDATISDWLNGKSVPSDPAALRFLVAYLQGAAPNHPRRPDSWWRDLRARAQAEKRRDHGRRRSATRPPDNPAADAEPLGWVIGELDDAAALAFEVHQTVTIAGQDQLPALPPYLPRAHDERLRAELGRARNGSRVIMLVGGSSTGKTRACWEAVRAVLPSWRVWHPLTPERPDAVVDALTGSRVAPHTVIWLNEAQMYLLPPGVGARVATALQNLLHDVAAGPVLVLGSMWPDYWRTLTDPHSTEHPAARALLGRGLDITVPARFSDRELIWSRDQVAADPRLRYAIDHGGGRVTQYLAGAPELIRRYEQANDHARAVLWAAVDFRRFGSFVYAPREVLYHATPGYLDAEVWGGTTPGYGWFADALTYLTEPCQGILGLLRQRRPPPDAPVADEVRYHVADYLEQIIRAERADISPPHTFRQAMDRFAPRFTYGEALYWD
ncbi:hypothetical protein [Virgisporangium aurantiacum]|uniref:Uncharacterized protein n=1 Tax=Virgisporangium aurantiacum TaxID=175570 RepID=A0A8J3ZJJ4_9ACTN|nr:hypothetical protein [Virgisporangium aurantiacum]GIJ64936.1 hypothetical protein Vau01_124520 [Virgisporangium aurantiacum]